MTESRRPRKPSSLPVFWGSLALFAILFAVLTYQLSAASSPAPQPVLVRKVIKRRVVTTVLPTPGATTVSSSPIATSSAPALAGEPVTTGAS